MGEEATAFAQRFFEGATLVRLERDDPKQSQGRYGRQLAHAFIERDGAWTHYNLECVRAGMSPYFTKYGYSQRFHDALSRAEAEARRARRGIWDPSAQSYRDYPERKAWWNARAEFIGEFQREARGRKDHIQLSHRDAPTTLERNLGREVTILSTIDRIRRYKGLVRVSLALRPDRGFPVIFFDKGAFEQSRIEHYEREPVTVRGQIDRYEKGSYRALQIVVDDPDQVSVPALPPPR